MSLRNLQKHNVVLPEEEWGIHDLSTNVKRIQLIVCLLFGAVTLGMMYYGGGGLITFIGTGLFMLFMAWITHISVKGVDDQAEEFLTERERFLREHPAVAEEDDFSFDESVTTEDE